MEKQTLKVSNFISRSDIEAFITSEFGQDIKKNKEEGHIITGSAKELKRFSLSDTSHIWGVKVVSKYNSTKKRLRKKLKSKNKKWE